MPSFLFLKMYCSLVVSLLSDPMCVVAASILVMSSSVIASASSPPDIIKSRFYFQVTEKTCCQAVLPGLLTATLLWLVLADQSLLHVTDRLDGLLLALVTDFPGLLLAVLGVAVLLGLLRASLLLQLADL